MPHILPALSSLVPAVTSNQDDDKKSVPAYYCKSKIYYFRYAFPANLRKSLGRALQLRGLRLRHAICGRAMGTRVRRQAAFIRQRREHRLAILQGRYRRGRTGPDFAPGQG